MKGFTITPAEIEARNASVRAEAIRCGDIKVANPASFQVVDEVRLPPAMAAKIFEPEKKEKKLRGGKCMNKTEARFFAELEARQRHGEFVAAHFERITLRLADGCRFTPDFTIVGNDGKLTFWEVKGAHVWEDSKIKFRVAREQNPWAEFAMFQWQKTQFVRIL